MLRACGGSGERDPPASARPPRGDEGGDLGGLAADVRHRDAFSQRAAQERSQRPEPVRPSGAQAVIVAIREAKPECVWLGEATHDEAAQQRVPGLVDAPDPGGIGDALHRQGFGRGAARGRIVTTASPGPSAMARMRPARTSWLPTAISPVIAAAAGGAARWRCTSQNGRRWRRKRARSDLVRLRQR